MNEALVNGPNTFLPSQDLGAAVAWEDGSLSMKGVVMDIGQPEIVSAGGNPT